jgi:hypothetical protein
MPKVWWRVLSWISSGLERFRKLVRTAEAALIVTCVIGALSVTGDMMLVAAILAIGIAIGIVAITTEVTLSRRNKVICCCALFSAMSCLGSLIFYYYHTDRKETQQAQNHAANPATPSQGTNPDVPLYSGPFQSTYERMIFVCRVPAPDPFEAPQFPRQLSS